MAITVPTDAYCTVAEMTAMLGTGRTIGASTNPSTTNVETWIKACAQEINDVLRAQGLTVPVTDTTSLARLSTLNALGAAALYEAAAQSSKADTFAGTVGHLYGERYKEGLKRLQQRGIGLGTVGTPAAMGPFGTASIQTGGDDETPTFTSGMDW